MGAKDNFKRKGYHGGTNGANKKRKSEEHKEQLSSSAQKRQAKKERQSHRRHAEIVSESKVLWNKLRLKSNSPEETKSLMKKVMELIRGKVKEIALQHDASRVVQAAIQFGDEEQRKELLNEICETPETLVEISKVQYAHFCCLKFIKYCARDDDCVKTIVKSFKGAMPKLAVHSVGSRIIESLFLNFPSKALAPLKQEFYGPHFSLFSRGMTDASTLKHIIEKAQTETQKEAAKSFVKDILTKGMTKSFYGFTYFQELLAEYIDVVEPSEIRSVASSVADNSIHLLSTRAGTRVVAACASYGTPKDRKRICKSLKGYTSSSLLHRDAYLALIRLVQVTDDTVSIHKSILNEILTAPKEEEDNSIIPPVLKLALSETGSKFFLMLLAENDEARMKYFDPYERTILETQPKIMENGKEVPTSKKDPDVRRQELLKYMSPTLVALCIEHCHQLLNSLPGSRILKEIYRNFASNELVEAMVNACESGFEVQSDDSEKEGESYSLYEHPIGHRSVKSLILCDSEMDSPAFSVSLVGRLGNRLKDVAKSNRGAFVAAALFKVSSVRSDVASNLKGIEKTLEKAAKKKGATAGYAALLKEITNVVPR